MTMGSASVEISNSELAQGGMEHVCLQLLKQKSPSTYIHCIRASMISMQFAAFLKLDSHQKERLISGCRMHDIGKLLVPSAILHSKSKLSNRDWSILKLHPVCGGHLIEDRSNAYDRAVWNIVMYHHERWDGNGYPSGLAGNDIPYLARICSVIDAFDSMTSDRGYRKGLPYLSAIMELERNSGTQFDPVIIEQFVDFTRQSGFLQMIYGLPVAI